MKREFIIEVIACILIILFVYAGVTKMFDYQKFVSQIGQSPLLTKWSGLLAWSIPALEVVIALLLALSRTRSIGLYASFTLMTFFTAYIIAATRFSDFVPCSCGGVIEIMSWSQHLVFNVIFMALAVIGIVLEIPMKSFSKG